MQTDALLILTRELINVLGIVPLHGSVPGPVRVKIPQLQLERPPVIRSPLLLQRRPVGRERAAGVPLRRLGTLRLWSR